MARTSDLPSHLQAGPLPWARLQVGDGNGQQTATSSLYLIGCNTNIPNRCVQAGPVGAAARAQAAPLPARPASGKDQRGTDDVMGRPGSQPQQPGEGLTVTRYYRVRAPTISKMLQTMTIHLT